MFKKSFICILNVLCFALLFPLESVQAQSSQVEYPPTISLRDLYKIKLKGNCRKYFNNQNVQIKTMKKAQSCTVELRAGLDNQPFANSSEEIIIHEVDPAFPYEQINPVELAQVVTNKKGKAKARVVVPRGNKGRQIGVSLFMYSGGGSNYYNASFKKEVFNNQPECRDFAERAESEITTAQLCQRDTDCNQVLAFGCGCHHNIPLNNSADVSALDKLLNEGALQGCAFVTVCDCKKISSSACVSGICQWIVEEVGIYY